ncbi:MAG: hypothetical protein EBZ48_02170, partial [Proteobacteria bacterium]|nr:hypothetical protein [Pseudomonadota bacterium]
MTNTAIAAVIRVAPAALGEQLRQFKTAAQRLFSSKLLAPGFCDTAEAVVLGSPDTAARKAAAFINLVLELQASDSGTSTLKWGLRHLPAIYAEGAEHAERFTRMAQAVAASKGVAAETRFARGRNLPRLFAAFNPSAGVYSGTSYALEQLCVKFATFDPFQAVLEAHVRWPLRSELQGGVSGEKVRADSTGGMMTSPSVYWVTRRGDAEAVPFVCGIEALTSIMGAFHTDPKVRAEWGNSKQLRAELEEQIGAALKRTLLGELLGAPLVERAEDLEG